MPFQFSPESGSLDQQIRLFFADASHADHVIQVSELIGSASNPEQVKCTLNH